MEERKRERRGGRKRVRKSSHPPEAESWARRIAPPTLRSSAVSLSPSVTTPFCQNDVPTKPVGGHWYRALPFVAFVTTSSPPNLPSVARTYARSPFSDRRGTGTPQNLVEAYERFEELFSFCARVKYTGFTSARRRMDRSRDRSIRLRGFPLSFLSRRVLRSVSLEAPEVTTTSHSYRRSCVKVASLEIRGT